MIKILAREAEHKKQTLIEELEKAGVADGRAQQTNGRASKG